MFEEGYVDDGFMLEFIHSHSSVLYQPAYNRYFSGLNPCTLGFNIFMDIKRMCQSPTEDNYWFPNLVGKDWLTEVHYAMQNFRDDSFILQYLSPKVIRDMKLFVIFDEEDEDEYEISAIHNERATAGYGRLSANSTSGPITYPISRWNEWICTPPYPAPDAPYHQ